MFEPLVDIQTVAKLLKVSVKTLYRWHYNKRGVPHYKIGKYLRYRLSEVEAWLKKGCVDNGQNSES